MPHAPHAVQCCHHMFICSCGYTHATHNPPTSPHPKPQTAIPGCCAVAYSLAWYDSFLRVHHPSPINIYVACCVLHILKTIKLHIQLDIKICCNLPWYQDAILQISSYMCNLIWLRVLLVHIMCDVWTANLPALHPAIRHACIMHHVCMYHAIVCMICYTLCNECSRPTIMPHVPHAVQCCRHMSICSCGYTHTQPLHIPTSQTPDRHTELM
jgi:hypothetical protein